MWQSTGSLARATFSLMTVSRHFRRAYFSFVCYLALGPKENAFPCLFLQKKERKRWRWHLCFSCWRKNWQQYRGRRRQKRKENQIKSHFISLVSIVTFCKLYQFVCLSWWGWEPWICWRQMVRIWIWRGWPLCGNLLSWSSFCHCWRRICRTCNSPSRPTSSSQIRVAFPVMLWELLLALHSQTLSSLWKHLQTFWVWILS